MHQARHISLQGRLTDVARAADVGFRHAATLPGGDAYLKDGGAVNDRITANRGPAENVGIDEVTFHDLAADAAQLNSLTWIAYERGHLVPPLAKQARDM